MESGLREVFLHLAKTLQKSDPAQRGAEEQYMSKILVVDDSLRHTAFMVDTLSGKGHHILTAVDGEEALQKVSIKLSNLILLDVVMPGKNGFSCLPPTQSRGHYQAY